MSPRNATAKPNDTTMNPEDQTPQAPLQSPVEQRRRQRSTSASAATPPASPSSRPGAPSCPTRSCAPRPRPRTPAAAPTKKSPRRASSPSRASPRACCRSRTASKRPSPSRTPTPEQLLEGVHATLRQLSAALERNKVIEINPPPGTKFDPHQHQAICVVPADQEPNTVVTVLQKGYLIADRVLRPALVTVSAPELKPDALEMTRVIPLNSHGYPQVTQSHFRSQEKQHGKDHRHRPGHHQLVRGDHGRQHHQGDRELAKARARRRRSSPTRKTAKSWSAPRPSARRSPTRRTPSTRSSA